ncbi:hypothetical protein GQ43DRAFT_97218 [Delitschia confertaspora ATCC 74209]|uniref:Uncharacterized protein n=1 Tax=Delitschia confertaspora ATCC 74209 TaxID=1513339 RepID=A0A9P4MUD2_9PLEO|nr:hypothetical protein GQ43DRAFT_97218 [Delitschia confertaspora ATCC 74209]
MSSLTSDWTIIMDHSEALPTQFPVSPQDTKVESPLTINTKTESPPTDDKTPPPPQEVASPVSPKYAESIPKPGPRVIEQEWEEGWRPALLRHHGPQRFRQPPLPPVPYNVHHRIDPDPLPPLIHSSSALLSKVNTYDGIADLPFSARISIYLVTYPFSDKDVKKWSWILKAGVTETWMYEIPASSHRAREGAEYSDIGFTDWDYNPVYNERYAEYIPSVNRRCTRNRNRNIREAPLPLYDGHADLPSVYLSRALDPAVVPETEKGVEFLIVVRNLRDREGRMPAFKLLVADSRKAAGIMLLYEAFVGNAIVFCGAVKDRVEGMQMGKGKGEVEFKRVEKFEERVGEEKGVVAVVC